MGICNVIFIKKDDDIYELWTKLGWLDRVSEVKEFVESCCKLERPLKEIRMEEDRQIWQAYIDGLNALNDSKNYLKSNQLVELITMIEISVETGFLQ